MRLLVHWEYGCVFTFSLMLDEIIVENICEYLYITEIQMKHNLKRLLHTHSDCAKLTPCS